MKEVLIVAACGTVGGLLAWVFSLTVGPQLEVSPYIAPFAFAFLGAGAGPIFIFLVANTDRTDLARLVSLALVAGFSWHPVLEGGRALVKQQTESGRVETALSVVNEADEIVRRIASTDPTSVDELAALKADFSEQISELARLRGQIGTIDGLSQVSARASSAVSVITAMNIAEGRNEIFDWANDLAVASGAPQVPYQSESNWLVNNQWAPIYVSPDVSAGTTWPDYIRNYYQDNNTTVSPN